MNRELELYSLTWIEAAVAVTIDFSYHHIADLKDRSTGFHRDVILVSA